VSVAFGTFRVAVRDPQFRTDPNATRNVAFAPVSTFRKAVRVYHQEGSRQAALGAISLASPYWTENPRGITLANNYRASLDRYFELDSADGRRYFDVGARPTVDVGGIDLNLYIDTLVYDLFGHYARICLWDLALPSEQQAAVMAAPVALGLQQIVGDDRAQEVAFWHLRTGRILPVTVASALSELPAAAEAVGRAAGTG
jgi:hypothetical protein